MNPFQMLQWFSQIFIPVWVPNDLRYLLEDDVQFPLLPHSHFLKDLIEFRFEGNGIHSFIPLSKVLGGPDGNGLLVLDPFDSVDIGGLQFRLKDILFISHCHNFDCLGFVSESVLGLDDVQNPVGMIVYGDNGLNDGITSGMNTT